uniref:Putative secreted protein n=1 Tax=Anopheles triannulatus TaxID=58253 RepID=A0A2M4B5M7_9DIPT
MAATTRTMGGKLPLFLFCSFFPLWLTTGREGVSTTCSRTAGERERDHWSLVCARVAGAIESSRGAFHSLARPRAVIPRCCDAQIRTQNESASRWLAAPTDYIVNRSG